MTLVAGWAILVGVCGLLWLGERIVGLATWYVRRASAKAEHPSSSKRAA